MTDVDPEKLPRHVAVIMDGNGRWARRHGFSRVLGHQKGVETVREIVKFAREMGIPWLTLYAFSEENWKRSRIEIHSLMNLLKRFLKSERKEMMEKGIRLQAIGRVHKLPADIRRILSDTIRETASNTGMTLTLALSYGGRQEITDAVAKLVRRAARGEITEADVTERLISGVLYAEGMPDPDLLIRTSGEYRVSNFLLWQIAYTEFFVTPTLWPDFNADEFTAAILDFQARERRFGGAEDP